MDKRRRPKNSSPDGTPSEASTENFFSTAIMEGFESGRERARQESYRVRQLNQYNYSEKSGCLGGCLLSILLVAIFVAGVYFLGDKLIHFIGSLF